MSVSKGQKFVLVVGGGLLGLLLIIGLGGRQPEKTEPSASDPAPAIGEEFPVSGPADGRVDQAAAVSSLDPQIGETPQPNPSDDNPAGSDRSQVAPGGGDQPVDDSSDQGISPHFAALQRMFNLNQGLHRETERLLAIPVTDCDTYKKIQINLVGIDRGLREQKAVYEQLSETERGLLGVVMGKSAPKIQSDLIEALDSMSADNDSLKATMASKCEA